MLIKLWKHECKRVIADRFTTPEDVDWFDLALAKVVEGEFGVDKSILISPGIDAYFVDFLRDAPETTGKKQAESLLSAPRKNNGLEQRNDREELDFLVVGSALSIGNRGKAHFKSVYLLKGEKLLRKNPRRSCAFVRKTCLPSDAKTVARMAVWVAVCLQHY